MNIVYSPQCPTFYHFLTLNNTVATYYYNAAVNTNWGTLGNWWLDSGYTLSASQLPTSLDNVIIDGNLQNLGQVRVIKNLEAIGGYIEINTYAISATESINFYGGGNDNAWRTSFYAPEINFYSSYENLATVVGNVINFYDSSLTYSLCGTANFYDESRQYQGFTINGDANFYDNSTSDPSVIINGNVSIHDNASLHETIVINGNLSAYSPATVNRNWTINGNTTYIGYGDIGNKYYYTGDEDTNWGTIGNWWLNSSFTVPAFDLPSHTKDVIVKEPVYNLGQDRVVKSLIAEGTLDFASNDSFSLSANSLKFLNGVYVYNSILSGDCLFYYSHDDGNNNITGNVILSGNNSTSSSTTINGNLIIHYPTLAGDLSLPTVNGTITVVDYKFEEYPDYNFNISGTSNPSANTFYGYIGFDGGKPWWKSLDNAYEFYRDGSHWYFGALNSDFNLVSDQQNVDYPWNVTSWTLQSGELDGQPIFNLVPFNKSDIVVSGIGNSGVQGLDLNGTYVLGYRGFGGWWGNANEEQVGINGRRPFYVKTNGSVSFWDWTYLINWNTNWVIYNENVSGSTVFDSDGAVPYYPTDVTTWYAGSVTGTPILRFAGNDPIAERDAKYATATESGAKRFRRLLALGYV